MTRTPANYPPISEPVEISRIALPAGHGPLYVLDGVVPRIAPDALVVPTAAVIGDVEVGPQSGIWLFCVLRGDTNSIRVGAHTSIQDGAIVHADPGEDRAEIGDEVTIGHGATTSSGSRRRSRSSTETRLRGQCAVVCELPLSRP